jgi:3-deoxy-D-manno-octulosonic-acid transferase
VVLGPSTFNFEEAAARAIAEGAAVRVGESVQAIAQAVRLSKDEETRARMGARAREFVAAHRGAVERFVDWLANYGPARD